jgi:hypothetical protein
VLFQGPGGNGQMGRLVIDGFLPDDESQFSGKRKRFCHPVKAGGRVVDVSSPSSGILPGSFLRGKPAQEGAAYHQLPFACFLIGKISPWVVTVARLQPTTSARV